MNPFNNKPYASNNLDPTTEPSSQTKQGAIEKLILYMLVVFAISFLAPAAYTVASPSTDDWSKAIKQTWQGHDSQLKKQLEDIWENPLWY